MPLRKDLSLSMPNPLRNVPKAVAVSQRETEVPVARRGDWSLMQYVNNYNLKASGIGFVSSPYTSLWDRIWEVTPVKDLPKFKALYSFVPRVQASVDVKVNLEINNGFTLEGGNNTFRDFLEEWAEAHDLIDTMRSEEKDAQVFGTSYTEPVMYEDSSQVAWLKTLDPEYMRIRQHCYKTSSAMPSCRVTRQLFLTLKKSTERSITFPAGYLRTLTGPLLCVAYCIFKLGSMTSKLIWLKS